MPRLTLADVKASRIPEAVNIPPEDARFIQILNECVQRLVPMGKFHGTLGRFRMNVTQGLITLPKQIAALEAVAVGRSPVPLRDMAYEYLGQGWGTRLDGELADISECVYRGRFPLFSDLVGVDKKLRLKCYRADDVGKSVTVMGYDENNDWIRTKISGVYYDGEPILIAQDPGTLSTNLFSAVTDIQFPDTMEGHSWLYEYSTTDTTQRIVGQYQYHDTRPSFARYLFPSIVADTVNTTTVEVLAKLDFIPVKNDTDYVIIGNVGALKLGCMAVMAEEAHNWAEANLLWYGGRDANGRTVLGAKQLLDEEMDHYSGSGAIQGINIVGPGAGFGEVVECVQ